MNRNQVMKPKPIKPRRKPERIIVRANSLHTKLIGAFCAKCGEYHFNLIFGLCQKCAQIVLF